MWIPWLACFVACTHTMESSDSPLVRHLLTSWRPAWQPSRSRTSTCEQFLVLFSHFYHHVFTGVCHSVHRGWQTPGQTPPLGTHNPGQTPPGRQTSPNRHTPTPKVATAANGTHPTRMLTCFHISLQKPWTLQGTN